MIAPYADIQGYSDINLGAIVAKQILCDPGNMALLSCLSYNTLCALSRCHGVLSKKGQIEEIVSYYIYTEVHVTGSKRC